jgi:hypothetical protein
VRVFLRSREARQCAAAPQLGVDRRCCFNQERARTALALRPVDQRRIGGGGDGRIALAEVLGREAQFGQRLFVAVPSNENAERAAGRERSHVHRAKREGVFARRR